MMRRTTIGWMAWALLGLAGTASAQGVTTGTGDGEMTYPAWSEQHAAGRYDAEADLVGGRFRARARAGDATRSEEVRAGTATGIRLTNPADAPPLTLPAGSIAARVSGGYARELVGAEAVGSSRVESTFAVRGAVSFRSVVRHEVSESSDAGVTDRIAFEDDDEHGLEYARLNASPEGLDYTVALPEITLAPGESITIDYQLTTATEAGNGGSSVVDFYTGGAEIHVVLPHDALVETGLPGDVRWIARAPEPGSPTRRYASLAVAATLALGLPLLGARVRSE